MEIEYIHYFETQSEYKSERFDNYVEPWVSFTNGSGLKYNKTIGEEMLLVPFTMEALGTGAFSWNLEDKTLQYSKNEGAWTTMDSSTTISVVKGDKVQFKGNNEAYFYEDDGTYRVLGPRSTVECNVMGNIMSLVDADGFSTANTVANTAFKYFFLDYDNWDAVPIVSARYLQLPADILGNECYSYMFYDGSYLIYGPEELPATTTAYGCYWGMFSYCTNMVRGPKVLPATHVCEASYQDMFYYCDDLKLAPEIKATELEDYACMGMFYHCDSLTHVQEVLPALTLGPQCYDCMFMYCYNLENAPKLPATTLAYSCYSQMFNGCHKLKEVPELPATTLTQSCYTSMFSDCKEITFAYDLPATALTTHCYYNMFRGCINLTSAPAISATTLASNCCDSMFWGCKSLTTSPILWAQTLVTGCYSYMFYGCSNLSHIEALFTTSASTTYTSFWVDGVASSGTFVKKSQANWTTTGKHGVPTGWEVEYRMDEVVEEPIEEISSI